MEVDCKQNPYEMTSHYLLRKEVYESCIRDGLMPDRALVVANAW